MDVKIALDYIEAYINGGDELGDVPEEDAADALEVIRARIAELEDERRWIPVEERLPEVVYHVSEYVWVATKYGVATCTYVPVDWPVDKWTYRRGWYLQNHGEPIDDIVTHWQPLPPPPQEG